MKYKKKLIEVALPLEAINSESAREKSIRHGHPSTLHLWWARRPLATARAVIWSSLVDDPSSHPEEFPTEEEQRKERARLFSVLSRLVSWENSNNSEILMEAKTEIMKSTGGSLPAFLDPFAGGGAIPLEAQRLGLEAHAYDLNPVAVMINKAMIEIPPKFAEQQPVNPEVRATISGNSWTGASGLAEDIRYYGEWVKKKAYERIGHLYPKMKIPGTEKEAPIIAWLWARTVRCPNPACKALVPLVGTFVLSKKKGNETYLDYCYIDKDTIEFSVHKGIDPQKEDGTKYVGEKGKTKRGTFRCPLCMSAIDASKYIDKEANEGRMGSIPMAIVLDSGRGREYINVSREVIRSQLSEVEDYYISHEIDEYVPHEKGRGTFASNAQGGVYGFIEYKDYFTKRQLIALSTFSSLAMEAQKQAEKDAIAAGLYDDHINISEGGNGAKAYGEAIGVYLSIAVDKLADRLSSLCSWANGAKYEIIRNVFSRQAISMTWDYAEGNPFSNSSGSWDSCVDWGYRCFPFLPTGVSGEAKQHDAQTDNGLSQVMISTDPPYYDNIEYADLSDFFYVWLRRSLKEVYPKLFRTLLVPKAEELVATPYRFNGDDQAAKAFFENGMYNTCVQLFKYAKDDIPVTIYYAFKQSDTDENDQVASSGWETMLSAIIRAGFSITGTWPMRTEMSNRSVASGANALASSIVLVCRKRKIEAENITRRAFINALHREMRPALEALQSANIAPVDLAQSAIGPGIGVFSRYNSVIEADGSAMSVRSALQIVNQELDAFYNEQECELDAKSRFCVDIFSQYAFNNLKFGDADIFARAKNTSVQSLVEEGVMEAVKGSVRLKTREEIPEKIDTNEDCCWKITQQLARAFDHGGVKECATAVMNLKGYIAENAKALAYRLYTICERKNWAAEGYAYNNLVVAWLDIQSEAAKQQAEAPVQMNMFDNA